MLKQACTASPGGPREHVPVDGDGSLILTIIDVYMGLMMLPLIAIDHFDDDSEKAAELWHAFLPCDAVLCGHAYTRLGRVLCVEGGFQWQSARDFLGEMCAGSAIEHIWLFSMLFAEKDNPLQTLGKPTSRRRDGHLVVGLSKVCRGLRIRRMETVGWKSPESASGAAGSNALCAAVLSARGRQS